MNIGVDGSQQYIPPEILVSILGNLNDLAMIAMEGVCRETNRKIQEAKLWKTLAENEGINTAGIDPRTLKEKVIAKRLFPEIQPIPEFIIHAIGGIKQVASLPKLCQGIEYSITRRIIIKPESMPFPIMRGTDNCSRLFIAFKLGCCNGIKELTRMTLVLHQRLQGNPNTWTKTTSPEDKALYFLSMGILSKEDAKTIHVLREQKISITTGTMEINDNNVDSLCIAT